MRCISCNSDNPGGAKFCIECGVPLKKRCPNCGFENLEGIKLCMGCGLSLSANVVRWAFGVALTWGLLTIMVAALTPFSVQALGQAVSGFLLVTLAFSVRRRTRTAAWCLVAYAMLDAMARILTHQGGLLLPATLFFVSGPAASYLNQYGSVESEGQAWAHFIYEFAF